MRKLQLFSLFAAMLIATSTWAATCGPWTSSEANMKYGLYGISEYASARYAELNSSQWGPTGQYNKGFLECMQGFPGGAQSYWGMVQNGNASPNQKMGGFKYGYADKKNVPSYTIKRVKWTFDLKVERSNTNIRSYAAFYITPNRYTWATDNVLWDFTTDYSNKSGETYKVAGVSGAGTSSQTVNIDFDNSTGNAQANKTMYMLLSFVMDNPTGSSYTNLAEQAYFTEGSTSEETIYCKVVKFSANNGSGTMATQVIKGSGNLNQNAFTRSNYTFKGWSTSAAGSVVYADKAAISVNESTKGEMTLYAVWEPNAVTVTLDKQGGTGGTNSVQAIYNSPMPSATMPTRTGYTFGGYYAGTNGSGNRYYNADGTSAINWNKQVATTIYAKWTIITYSISITLNGGHWIDYPTSYNITSSDIKLKNLTRDGYTFKGWTGSNGNTPQKDVKIAKGSTGNKNYTANWDPIVYNITYDYAGGEGNNPATYTIETPTFSLNNPTRLGYTFVGWTGSNGYIPEKVVTINKGEMYDNSYTAHWEIDPNTNVAYLDSLDQTAAQEIAAFHRPEAPEVPGFTFLYWQVKEGLLMDGIYLQAVYAENEPSGAPKKQVGKFTLTRQGNKNEYILQLAK